MKNSWFVVVAAEEAAGEAEVGGPLVGGEVIDFEESGLALHWKDGTEDEDDSELVVVDSAGEEISTSDPMAWDVHSHFSWRQIIIEDTEGEQWIIIAADSQAEADAVAADQDALSEQWLDGPPDDDDDEDDNNDGFFDADEGDEDDD